ncbi:MAG: hypothetical protein ABIY55_23370 [Kofleriaceae bacterium]
MPAASEQIKRMAIVCVTAFVLANVAFYVMSGSYFASHREIVVGVGSVASYTPELAMHVRMTFMLFTGVVAASGFAAGVAPRTIGHLLPVLLGLANFVGAVGAFTHDAPAVVGMTLLVAGILLPLLAHFSYRGSRSAWAFLVAMCGVFALVEFFGAPKVSRAINVGLWTAMILPGLNAVAVAALASLRGTYVERTAA